MNINKANKILRYSSLAAIVLVLLTGVSLNWNFFITISIVFAILLVRISMLLYFIRIK
ncbi:TPA: hypothetical protein H1011_01320 [archaeon]|uniref:Uncharacterized protein n=1 Tax=Candidatus Undinarchaeum marinum TaxID=2756141 RepID=A0A832V0C0_9ARCH|nr:hypothetical protein [Candidatus Undinarchaeum marinum]